MEWSESETVKGSESSSDAVLSTKYGVAEAKVQEFLIFSKQRKMAQAEARKTFPLTTFYAGSSPPPGVVMNESNTPEVTLTSFGLTITYNKNRLSVNIIIIGDTKTVTDDYAEPYTLNGNEWLKVKDQLGQEYNLCFGNDTAGIVAIRYHFVSISTPPPSSPEGE